MCGDDGKSEQTVCYRVVFFAFYDEYETGKVATNALIKVLRFKMQRITNVLAENEGDIVIVFSRCVPI
jgi:hypothetical protein